MKNALLYCLSLILSILLALIAFFTLVTWSGTLIHGVSRLPLLELVPWNTLALVGLAAINCTVRARLIKGRNPMETAR